MTLFGVDAASPTLREADHLIHDLVDRLGLPRDTLACTHLIRGGAAHVALSFDVPGDPADLVDRLTALAEGGRFGAAVGEIRFGPTELASAAADAITEHAERRGGRAVVFPGVDTLTATVSVGTILAGSAIDRIAVLAGHDPPAEASLVDTRDHVRPEWRAGELTLTTTLVEPGRYAPFEVPNPTPCCADHS